MNSQHKIGATMLVLGFAIVIALLTALFDDALEEQVNPNRQVQGTILEGGVHEVVLERNRMGHYVTSGRINGTPVVFLVDTGATTVAVPESVSRKLGLPRLGETRVHTANGTATAHYSRLDHIELGSIAMQNIDALVTPGMEGEEILLGMSFLRDLEFTQRGRQLILRQYPR